jgi:hypothetical protein
MSSTPVVDVDRYIMIGSDAGCFQAHEEITIGPSALSSVA